LGRSFDSFLDWGGHHWVSLSVSTTVFSPPHPLAHHFINHSISLTTFKDSKNFQKHLNFVEKKLSYLWKFYFIETFKIMLRAPPLPLENYFCVERWISLVENFASLLLLCKRAFVRQVFWKAHQFWLEIISKLFFKPRKPISHELHSTSTVKNLQKEKSRPACCWFSNMIEDCKKSLKDKFYADWSNL